MPTKLKDPNKLCPFLTAGKVLIGLETSELSLNFNNEKMVFDAYEWTPYADDLEHVTRLKTKVSRTTKEGIKDNYPA